MSGPGAWCLVMISPSRLKAQWPSRAEERGERREEREERRSDIASSWQQTRSARLLLQPSPKSHGLLLWDCNTKGDPSPESLIDFMQKNSSSLDLNDAVVMEDLLKKLKQRLKDQGLNDDIKLSLNNQSAGKVFHKEEKKTKKKETCAEKDEL